MKSIQRRSNRRGATSVLAALAAASMFAGGCTMSSGETVPASNQGQLEPVTLVAAKGSIPGLPLFVADSLGFFEEEGLDADLIDNLSGGGPIMSALTSGSADIVTQTVSASALALQQGMKVPIVAGQGVGVPYVLVVGSDSDVPVAADDSESWKETIRGLQGTTIAAAGGGSGFDVILRALFEEAGLNPDDFSNISLAHGGPELAALQTGQVDAVFTDSAPALQIEAAGAGKTVLTMWEQGPQWLQNQAWSGFIATAQTIEQRPELISRFQAVVNRVRLYFQDPANVPEIKRIATERAAIADSPGLDDAIGQFAGLLEPGFTLAQVQTTVDFMRLTGQLPEDSSVDASGIVIDSVLLD